MRRSNNMELKQNEKVIDWLYSMNVILVPITYANAYFPSIFLTFFINFVYLLLNE